MRESQYQAELMYRIQELMPDCVVLKNDAEFFQGIPDLIVLYGRCWGMLEVKISEKAAYRPNQQFYVDEFNKMSFAAVIYPEIEMEVLNALQRSFTHSRPARLPKR
jgi:hypothetical protein